jgi:hypothetical protein
MYSWAMVYREPNAAPDVRRSAEWKLGQAVI